MHRTLLALGLSLVVLPFIVTSAQAQSGSVRGFVTDQSNGEALQGVNVVVEDGAGTFLGNVTDGDGIYVIAGIPPGSYTLRASFIGYQTHTETIQLVADQRLNLNIALAEDEAQLDEVVVETEREGGAARLIAGMQSVRPRDIEAVPAPDVSGDLVNYLTTMPGIVTIGDRGGQLFVRGGEPSHNLVLFDGMYIYQPFHMLGFYSAFPSDIINRADVYAAGYGSRFSGRASSVIDVHSRNGNKRGYAGSASVAPFVSAVTLEGPLVRDKMSFIGSLRESVIEQGAAQYVDQDLPYRFGDAFGKIHYIMNENHRLSITGLRTHDRGTLGAPTEDRVLDEVRWRNSAYGLRYVFLPESVPFVGEILFSASRLRAELGPEEFPVRFSRVNSFSYAVNITNFIGTTEWHWGLFWRSPEVISFLSGAFQDAEFGFGRRHKAGIYIEPDFYINESVRIRLGANGELFPGQNKKAFVEPRIRLLWQRGVHEFSAAAGFYHQEIVGINDRRDATNVFTAWRSAPSDQLTEARHALVGYRVNPIPWLELSVEAYYKRVSDLYIAEWTSFPRFTTRLQRADGEIAGLDFRLEVSRPSFYAFVNYGLSSVEYEAKQASLELWYGTETLKFRPPHDRRHQINALVSTSVAGFDISMRWNFGSGRPFNRVFGFDGFVLLDGIQDLFNVGDEQRVIYERPFRGRLPTYHRLDLSIDRVFDFDGFLLTAQAGIINVYNRRNLFALDLFTLRRTDQLPFIPTVGLKVEFQ